MRSRARVFAFIVTGGAVLVIAGCLRILEVSGDSMEDTFREGDIILAIRVWPFASLPLIKSVLLRPGRIVVCQGPDRQSLMVKRIAARSGQTVRVDHGALIVDGVRQPEPYAKEAFDSWPVLQELKGPHPVRIPAGHYFVLSDRRRGSVDSRVLGPVPEESIVDVVWTVVKRSSAAYITSTRPKQFGLVGSMRPGAER